MTLTDQHIRALTFLACDTRPHGARQWRADEVYAEIAKVRDRSLGAVICAVTRAAMDRGAERPAVITSAGSHWSDTMLPTVFVPRTLAADERCSVCSEPEPACRARHGGRCNGCGKGTCGHHEFESAAMAVDRAAGVAAARLAKIRAELAPTSGPTERRTLEDMAEADPVLHARLERLRAANPGLAGVAMQETESCDESEAVEA